jgi:hypothetical protein
MNTNPPNLTKIKMRKMMNCIAKNSLRNITQIQIMRSTPLTITIALKMNLNPMLEVSLGGTLRIRIIIYKKEQNKNQL